jgi:hypothetical protein
VQELLCTTSHTRTVLRGDHVLHGEEPATYNSGQRHDPARNLKQPQVPHIAVGMQDKFTPLNALY